MIEIITKNPPIEDIYQLYLEAGWLKDKVKEKKNILDLIKGSFCFAVATENGKTVGMGRAISDGVSDGYILDIFVKESYRHQKIGHRLVETILDYCKRRGLLYINLIAEPDTESFYESLGFRNLKGYIPMEYK